jgi:hypothetical protein
MSAAIPTGGPDLGDTPGMLRPEAPPRAADHSPAGHALPIAVVLISAVFAIGLWLADYTRWRIAVAALLLASMIPRTSAASVLARLRIGPRSVEPLLATATHLAIAALTGGLRIPFLVAIIGPFTGMLQSYGWSRSSQGALSMIGAGAMVMAVLPSAWFGPQVSEPTFSLLTALMLISVAVTNGVLFVMMTRALSAVHGEVDRAREQLAAQALARARV